MFEYKGQQYSLQQLQDFASENNVEFDQYMANMRELGMTETVNAKSNALQAIWNTENIPLSQKISASTAALFSSLKDPNERAQIKQISGQIKRDLPKQLYTSLLQTQAASVDWLRGAAGEDFTDFILDKNIRQNSLVYIDPNTQQEVSFKENKERWKQLNELKKQGEAIKQVYSGTDEELGDATDEWLINKFKEIEKTKLLYEYDGKGMVKGFKSGDVSDVIGGVMNSVSSMVQTMAPAIATRGASLFPQVVSPMYTEYNIKKAQRLYGEEDDQALDKLIANNETEVAVPMAIGALATGLEYVGFKGVTNYISSVPGKTAALAKLLWLGNAEGFTELGQFGLETANNSLAEGKSVEQASIDAVNSMVSEEGLEMYLSGFVGSTTIGTSGNLINRALRSDNASINDINNKINNLAKLNNTKYNTRNKKVREAIDLEIKEAEQDLKDYINNKRKLKNVLTNEEQTSLINTLKQKDDLKVKIDDLKKQLDNNIISNKEFGYAVRGLNNQDKKLSNKLNEIQSSAVGRAAEQTTETVKTFIQEGDLPGQVTEMTSDEISESVLEREAELRAEIENAKDEKQKKAFEQELQDIGKADKQFGFILQSKDGSFEVVLNKDKPAFGTAAHEFMHAVLFKTLGNQQQLQDALGDALVEHTSKIKGDKTALVNRLSAYGRELEDGTFVRDANFGEETITIMSESILDGSLKFEENFFTKIGDLIRQTLQRYGLKEIKFDTGRDVYNFVKDYSKSIKEGRIDKSIINLAKEGAKGKLIPKKADPKAATQMSKEASDNVQRIYDNVGEKGAMDIIAQFKPIVNKIVDKRRDAPNFDRQLLTDEIETGKRGIFDLIREYDPKSGVPLAAYINKFLPARAIEASKRVLGEEFAQDVTERVDIAAEEVTTEVKAKPKPKKIVLADRLGIGEKVNEAIKKIIPTLEVKDLTFKSLKNKIPEVVGDLFGIAPKKLITNANITKGELQSSQMFISKNADLLINMLPEGATASGTATGIPNSLLKAFYTKTGRAKMAKTGSAAGLAIQQKNKINRKQFLEVFGIVDGKPNRTDRNTSAKVIALANTLGKMITNQAVRQQDLKLSNESIAKLKDGKSNIMFSKQTIENVKSDKNGNFTKNSDLIGPNGEKITTVPSDKVLITKQDTETGLFVGDVVTIKQMDALWDSDRGITWQDHMSARLNVFLDRNPQYYDALQELFTGGVKRTAYMTKDIFEVAIPKTDKIKQTEQISASRLDYHRSLNEKEKEKGLKGKRLRKNIQELDTLKDKDKTKTFINLFNNIGKYLNEGQNMLDLWLMEEMLLHSSVDQNNFFRKSAPLLGFPIDDNGNPIIDQVVIEEHTPINEVIKIAMGSAIRNKIKDITPLLESLLSQFSILAKDDPSGKLKSSMGIDFYNKVAPRILDGSLKLKPGHAGIYRLMKHGVNPFRYKLLESGKTIAQEFGVEGMTVEDARENIIKYFEGEVSLEYNTQMSKVSFSKDINSYNRLNKAISFSRSTKPSKGITVLDFDDTLATTESLVKYTAPDGTTGTLNAEQFASTYQDLQDQGYTFDFSDFNRVVKGKLAPLFNKALKLQKKFGPENMFVLTARPPAAQQAIFDFLKANGLNIPLKNITGLGNSTSEAKALWMADKVSEGYNDFYFADDALQNVQAVKNMLDQFDVKSKIQQAKVQFSKDIDSEFNKILEEVTGIKAGKRFSDIKARKRGENKGKFRLFIPPSHEDFVGLLYNFMGKGRKGDQHRNFFEQALVKPLNRAYREIDTAKQAIANDYKSLNKKFPNVNKKLTKKTPDGDFTFQDAIRVYLWDKHGYDIPGLSKTDKTDLVEIVKNDAELQAYAETLNIISKQETYVDPGPNWETGNIRIDLIDATGRVGRASYFTEFNENAEIIFSSENLNKIEAAYGKSVREALEDMLHRIKTGINRPKGASAKPNMLLNWLNASVSGVMFFNTRSALLQQLSNVNFINFADNNIYAAGKAFANQKQYWKDFAMIFNSDMLKQRRGGLQTDINGAELAEAIKKARPGNLFDQVAIITGKALRLGFLPTQIGDSIAIATGGATFYRNRVNKYIKDGMSVKEAEASAFTDLQDITNATQQSARPDMTSAQQAAVIGKIVLNFLNTPSQYNRIIKKAGSDIINRRITPPNTTRMQSNMSNMSRILYYGAAQNLIFYSLQTALFAVMFGLDDEDEQEKAEQLLKKRERVINGSIDTILRGSGVYGVAVSTIKNMVIKFLEQREKGYNKDESAVIMEMLNFSPVVGIKARKIVNAEKTLNYNKKVIDEMETFDIDNPMWSAVTNYIEVAGPPANRIYQKTINLRNASDNQYTAFQRAMFLSGYTTWSLGLGDNQKIKDVKEKIKDKKKNKKKSSRGTLGGKSL